MKLSRVERNKKISADFDEYNRDPIEKQNLPPYFITSFLKKILLMELSIATAICGNLLLMAIKQIL